MNCKLVLATDECINYFVKHRSEVDSFIWGEPQAEPGGFMSQIFKSKSTASCNPKPKYSRFDGDECDLNGAWHGLQFLLTKRAWDEIGPLSFFVASGTPLNDEATIVGFTCSEVAEVHSAISGIATSEFRNTFDAEKMTNEEIYPFSWNRVDALDWLLREFDSFQMFIKKAVDTQLAVIRVIC